MDKQSGMGRGRKPNDRKGGAGKANWGEREDVTYKRKREQVKGEDGEVKEPKEGEEEEEAKVEAPVEEVKKEEIKEEVVEEILGVSLADFRKDRNYGNRAEARAAEGMKDKKAEIATADKIKQSTVQKNEHGAAGFSAGGQEKEFLNFIGNDPVEEETGREGRDGRRGGRGGRGRGGGAEGGQRGGRR